MCYKTGRVSTRDFTVFCVIESILLAKLMQNTVLIMNRLQSFTVQPTEKQCSKQGYRNRYNINDRLSGSCNFFEMNKGLGIWHI